MYCTNLKTVVLPRGLTSIGSRAFYQCTSLEKIIYTADIIEPSRRFVGVEELRVAVDNDFENGFKICAQEILEFLQKSGEEIYPLSIEACEFYK